MSGRPNNSGIYQFDNLNTQVLYVKNKRFEDYITELVFEDQLEQSEITEIKLLLEYLDTTGLNSAWLVNNGNTNETLRSAITALQTKLANIDTTGLTESSVLNNDNRNSVLKTRLDTAEGDIDGVETKTRFIVEASITGTGDNTVSTYRTRVGPTTEEKGSTLVELNMKNAPVGELIGYTIKSNFNNDSYADNESIYSHRGGRLTLLAHTMRLQAAEQIRIGNFAEYGDGASAMAINIGGRGNKINIGRIDSQNSTGDLTEINLGYLGGVGGRNTNTSIDGNVYLAGSRFADLTKSTSLTLTSLAALYSTGAPSWVLGFFSGTSSLPYSDVWCMKGGFLANKDGDVETSNSIMVKELYVVNKDIVAITPKVGFFLAKADYSCTQLIGDHRTQVFEGEIVLRNNNITSTNVNWLLTGANDACNVVNIAGNSGILIHQGASDSGTPLRIYNTCSGSIDFGLGTGGTQASVSGGASGPDGMSIRSIPLTNTNGSAYTGAMVRVGLYFGGNPQTNPFFGTYQMEVNQYPGREGMIVAKVIIPETGPQTFKNTIINGDSISTQGTITGIDVVGSTSISAPTATATSLVFNGNYTGDTTGRLYKNSDNKLMFNGEIVGGGGVSSGGITYMINVPTNITNPNPTPTETIMTAAYSGNAQRTITQAVTANTAYYIAKYTTEVFDEASNPVLTGLQQLNQYLVWSSNNHTGQIYGLLWFQATAVGSATLYQRTYASPVTTTAAQLINGTPIPTPKGQYSIKFQRVVFPNINVVVSSGPVVLRFRVEGLISASWTTIAMSPATGQSVSSTTNNLTVSLDETIDLNQTTAGVASALRLVLFIHSGTGTISQTSAGGADLGAYSLIGVGANTPGLFRTLLHDGTNAKVITPHTTTPTLIEYDLPIDEPYNVSAFPSPTLSTDLYFVQPTGGGNNSITLYFNDGSLSHYHSTISPPQVTPTLAQVLNSGATASQAINMNTNKISGITTLEGSSGVNWNVREISAGTNISVSSSTGTYTVTNNAPTQDVAGGTGIQISKNGTTATITNNAAVQNLTAGTGISIAVDTPTRNATITNSGILSVSAGTGIIVSTTNGVATITNTASAGGQVARDQLSATSSVGLVPNKLSHYAQNWTTESVSVQPQDIFVSHDGRNCVYIPAGSSNNWVQYSLDSGSSWTNSNVWINNFLSICGSTTGEVLYITRFGPTTGTSPNVVYSSNIYVSYNYGLFWTELSLDRTPGAANTWYNRFINQIRCSADGSVVIASTFRTTSVSGVPNDGTLYISTNGGASWVVRNITAGPAQVADCCMSANGAIMFAAMNGVLGGATDNGNGGIYRSFDFGATWTKVRNPIAAGTTYFFGIIKCDATGRFLVACDQSQTEAATGQIHTSDDYGSGWAWFGDEQARGATAAFVSPGGNLMITAHDPTYNSRIRYSMDYGRNWINAINFDTVFTVTDNLNGATLRTLASNHDGSVLFMRASANAIYRCIEERGRLASVVGSRDLTITPAFGGGYTILNNPVETLFASGSLITSTDTAFPFMDWSSRGEIDLTLFNIRYEIECNWNYSGSVYPAAFIHIAPNNITATDYQNNDPNTSNSFVAGVTNWTNIMAGGTWGNITGEFNQSYRNRFMGGFAHQISGGLTEYRCRTVLNGELMLQTRPTGQSGITDPSPEERNIFNRFTCNNYTTQRVSGSWLTYQTVGSDFQNSHMRQDGTAIFSAQLYWNGFLASGINRIGLRLNDGFTPTDTRPRGAHYVYRIYRVRK
jgi:hypothetical protein